MSKRSIEDVVADMLAGGAADAADVAGRFEQAQDVEYWRGLVPELGLERPTADPIVQAGAIDLTALAATVAREGYFQLHSVFPLPFVERLLHAIEQLRAHDWHPTFAFVYDELWAICRAPQIDALLTALLGPGFRQTPRTWAHYVPAAEGAGGWPAHVDDAAARRKVTLWISLTDATIDNGCMYVVPKHRAPRDIVAEWSTLDAVPRDNVLTLLQNARPLPAPAGSVLGWEMGVMHWGSVARRTNVPRVSVSYDFISADEPPASNELPLLSRDRLPTFRQRLTFIAENILDYGRFEAALRKYERLARRVIDGEHVG